MLYKGRCCSVFQTDRCTYNFQLPNTDNWCACMHTGKNSISTSFSFLDSYLCRPSCEWLVWPCPCKSPPCSSGSGVLQCCDGSSCKRLHSSSLTACTAPCWIGNGGRVGCICTLRREKCLCYCIGQLNTMTFTHFSKSSPRWNVHCSKKNIVLYYRRAEIDFPVRQCSSEWFIIYSVAVCLAAIPELINQK